MRKKEKGFTLVELAVVLAIVGVIMVGLAAGAKVALIKEQRNKVDTTLDEARTALSVYAQDNLKNPIDPNPALQDFDADGVPDANPDDIDGGNPALDAVHYPCPANPALPVTDPNYGREQRATFDGACTGFSVGAPPNRVFIGSLPTTARSLAAEDLNEQTMSIPSSLTLDVYGNKLTYAVSESVTTGAAMAGGGGGVQGSITVNSPGSAPITGVHFVLLSHGQTGLGAYSAYGTVRQGCVAGTADFENCDDDATFFASNAESLLNGADFNDDRLVFTLADKSDEGWVRSLDAAAVNVVARNTGNFGVGITASGDTAIPNEDASVDNPMIQSKVYVRGGTPAAGINNNANNILIARSVGAPNALTVRNDGRVNIGVPQNLNDAAGVLLPFTPLRAQLEVRGAGLNDPLAQYSLGEEGWQNGQSNNVLHVSSPSSVVWRPNALVVANDGRVAVGLPAGEIPSRAAFEVTGSGTNDRLWTSAATPAPVPRGDNNPNNSVFLAKPRWTPADDALVVGNDGRVGVGALPAANAALLDVTGHSLDDIATYQNNIRGTYTGFQYPTNLFRVGNVQYPNTFFIDGNGTVHVGSAGAAALTPPYVTQPTLAVTGNPANNIHSQLNVVDGDLTIRNTLLAGPAVNLNVTGTTATHSKLNVTDGEVVIKETDGAQPDVMLGVSTRAGVGDQLDVTSGNVNVEGNGTTTGRVYAKGYFYQ